jgi:hypothetical protein
MAKTVYSAEQGDKGQVIDLDTGRPVEGADWVDVASGVVRVPKVSAAYALWLLEPGRFSGGPPPKHDAVWDAEKRKHVLATELRRGRFKFVPAGEKA